jgi:oxygen-independent coproporphyrinogen-3 oxidase
MNQCYNSHVIGLPGIYIHIPFCERKCTYCNFNTTDFFEDLAEKYVNAVSQEIRYWGRRLAGSLTNQRAGTSFRQTAGPAPAGVSATSEVESTTKACVLSDGRPRIKIDSIYFGGGTPSIIAAELIARLISTCRESFEVEPAAEITIEINPGSFAPSKVETWLAAGVNRASIGAQSFINGELESLSRTHSAEDVIETVDLLRRLGFSNISLDLIAGLPGQTRRDWEFNLDQALRLGPEHLSLYLLEIKEGTQLYAQLRRGSRPSPDEDEAARMYEITCGRAHEAGYLQYEISNFCAGGPGSKAKKDFRSKHNLKYWTGAAFYGMGCGAHSYDGRSRWFNSLRTETYIEQVAISGHAVAEWRDLTPEERASEALFMGLRLSEGIDLNQFSSQYGYDPLQRFGAELPRLREAGLIDISPDRIALTDSGRLLSNEVFVALI